ncbi:DNA repair and recombination protein RAD54-like isoform X2 [Augochlora pura]
MKIYGRRYTNPILIISYEISHLHAHVLHLNKLELILCNEGYRLNKSKNWTSEFEALMSLKVERRVLLSETCIQIDLLGYVSFLHFLNQGLLGTIQTGTIEERIFQIEAHKKGFSSAVNDQEEAVVKHFTLNDLRTLFKSEENTKFDTHSKFK